MTQNSSGPHNEKHAPLQIHAEAHADLHLLSAHMQDALLPVSGLRFHNEMKRFHLMANRFRWELEEEDHNGTPLYYRTHCAMSFGHVDHVQHKGFDPAHPTHILSLLAIRGHDDGSIRFHCSNGAAIHLHASKILCRLCDIGEHWPTRNKPAHN